MDLFITVTRGAVFAAGIVVFTMGVIIGGIVVTFLTRNR